MMKRVEGKLGKMRKPQRFIVMPEDNGENVVVQSDKSIGRLNIRTGAGVLNTKGCYFPHLNKMLGAVDFQFPEDFVAACLDACPALDGTVDLGGIVTARPTIQTGGPDR